MLRQEWRLELSLNLQVLAVVSLMPIGVVQVDTSRCATRMLHRTTTVRCVLNFREAIAEDPVSSDALLDLRISPVSRCDW